MNIKRVLFWIAVVLGASRMLKGVPPDQLIFYSIGTLIGAYLADRLLFKKEKKPTENKDDYDEKVTDNALKECEIPIDAIENDREILNTNNQTHDITGAKQTEDIAETPPPQFNIEGWLYLPAIVLVLIFIIDLQSLWKLFILLQKEVSFATAAWRPDIVGHQRILIFEYKVGLFLDLARLIFLIYAMIQFFGKKKNAHIIIIVYLIVNIVSVFMISWVAGDHGVAYIEFHKSRDFEIGLLNAAILIPYLLFSTRVKATFTNKKKASYSNKDTEKTSSNTESEGAIDNSTDVLHTDNLIIEDDHPSEPNDIEESTSAMKTEGYICRDNDDQDKPSDSTDEYIIYDQPNMKSNLLSRAFKMLIALICISITAQVVMRLAGIGPDSNKSNTLIESYRLPDIPMPVGEIDDKENTDYVTYHSKKWDFTIKHPNNWDAKMQKIKKTWMLGIISPSQIGDNLKENIVINSRFSKFSNLEYWKNSLIGEINARKGTEKLIDHGYYRMGSNDTAWILQTTNHNGMTLKHIQFLIVKGTKVFLITGTAMPRTFDRYYYIFKKIASSITFE